MHLKPPFFLCTLFFCSSLFHKNRDKNCWKRFSCISYRMHIFKYRIANVPKLFKFVSYVRYIQWKMRRQNNSPFLLLIHKKLILLSRIYSDLFTFDTIVSESTHSKNRERTIMEKNSATFSLGALVKLVGISNALVMPLYKKEPPVTMFLVHWWTIVVGSFVKGALPLIEIPFQIVTS